MGSRTIAQTRCANRLRALWWLTRAPRTPEQRQHAEYHSRRWVSALTVRTSFGEYAVGGHRA